MIDKEKIEFEELIESWRERDKLNFDVCADELLDVLEKLDIDDFLVELNNKESEEKISFPIGYLKNKVNNWDDFCNDVGLNPWCLAEGLATNKDMQSVSISVLKKYGILK